MNIIRFAASTPFAIIVTVMVFVMMYTLIKNDEDLPPPPEPREIPALVQPTPELPPEPTRRIPPDPLPEAPPPPNTTPDPIDPGETGPIVGTPPEPPDPTELGTVLIDPLTPMVTVPPNFPSACAARGISGTVVVEYDITWGGEVVNPRVVSSTDRCFEREALRAIAQWRYRPTTSDQTGIRVTGERQSIAFQLQG